MSEVWRGVSKEGEVDPSRGRAVGEKREAEEARAEWEEERPEVEERHSSNQQRGEQGQAGEVWEEWEEGGVEGVEGELLIGNWSKLHLKLYLGVLLYFQSVFLYF